MIPKVLDGVTWQVPEKGEKKWSAQGTGILVAVLDRLENAGAQSGGSFFPADSVATTTLAAGATLTPAAGIHRVSGTSGAVTLDETTPIASGVKAGQGLTLMGTDAVNTVTILSSSTNMILNGNCVLSLGEVISFRWDATLAKWVETDRSN